MRRRGTSCMLPRSRAGEKVARATFFRKTQWFQHTFPLSPESGPGDPREILGGSRGALDVSPGLYGGVPWSLPGCFLQDSYSEIPPQENVPEDSLCRMPPRIPLLEFLLEESFLRIPLDFLLEQSSTSIASFNCLGSHAGVICMYVPQTVFTL